jgi:hypothetical protein
MRLPTVLVLSHADTRGKERQPKLDLNTPREQGAVQHIDTHYTAGDDDRCRLKLEGDHHDPYYSHPAPRGHPGLHPGGLAIAAPAAFAMPVPIDGFKYTAPAIAPQTVTPVVVIGGRPGWQIASIAAGAAVLAAVLAVLAYRALIAHRSTAPSLG